MSALNAVRARVLVIVAIVVLSLWRLYPPQEKIQLGLDLKGGVQLVLRVRTDEALERAARQRGEPLAPEEASRIRRDTVQQAIDTIERRVNALGVAEPVIARYGRDDRILVQLPGAVDIAQAKRIMRSTAQLRLTLVEGGPFNSAEEAVGANDSSIPADLEVLPHRSADTGKAVYYVLRKDAPVVGQDLRDARQAVDEFNRPAVAFTLQPDAAARFGRFTAAHVNRPLATVIDGQVLSVATIVSRIDDRGQIVGLSRDEMIEQVIALQSGALPATLDYLSEQTVSASLGRASVRAGILASAGGLALVGLFMVAYYRRSGLNALVSIVLNLVILTALMAYFGAAMTLPGIAGLILTIGIGVDSNVLIFERIREELPAARGARAAVRAGFDRVWLTIVDTHVASLTAAAFLFQFGTGAIRGFATALTLGLVANVFTAVFVSRTLFDVILLRRRPGDRTLSI